MTLSRPLEERFWEKVDKSGECWEWTAARDRDGYGQIGRGNGKPGNMVGAHRVSYQIAYGPIPAGMVIDHTCRNRGCVNPGHLNAVTHKQNLENRSSTAKSKTGIRGVYRHRSSPKFQVSVGHHGKHHYVGMFETLKEAEAAAIAKRNELHTNNLEDRSAV